MSNYVLLCALRQNSQKIDELAPYLATTIKFVSDFKKTSVPDFQ